MDASGFFTLSVSTRTPRESRSHLNTNHPSCTNTPNAFSAETSRGMIRFQTHRISTVDAEAIASAVSGDFQIHSEELGGSTTAPTLITNRSNAFSLDDIEKSSTIHTDLFSLSDANSLASIHQRVSLYCGKRRHKTSLRRQIMVPFGILSCLFLGFIMASSVWTVLQSRNSVLRMATNHIQTWAHTNTAKLIRYSTDIVDQRFQKLEGLLAIVQIVTQERFAGYPENLSQNQSYTDRGPFPNYLQPGTNSYPWTAKDLLPFQHDIVRTVNYSNWEEHVGTFFRFSWYSPSEQLSTSNAVMVGPTNDDDTTFSFLHSRASDYAAPLLKALYEQHSEIRSIELHFVNDGHGGATVVFPARNPVRFRSAQEDGVLVGCEWLQLANPINPSKPILPEEQRKACAKAPEEMILQQRFCRNQALNPHEYQIDSPYKEDGRWWIRVGKAIYDSETGEFLACTSVVINIYMTFTTLNGRAKALTLRWSDDLMYSATGIGEELLATKKTPPYFHELGLFDEEFLQRIKADILAGQGDDKQSQQEFTYTYNGWYIAAWPWSPVTPDTPHGHIQTPQFLNLVLLDVENVTDIRLEDLRADVDPYTQTLTRTILVVGFVCMLLILLCIFGVSLFLTIPLVWMHKAGNQILVSAGSAEQQHSSDRASVTSQNTKDLNFDIYQENTWWYKLSPRTEVMQLVGEFHQMVRQFSGKGTAKLFKQQFLEVKNPFTLHQNLQSLYERHRIKRASSDYMASSLEMPEGESSLMSFMNLTEPRIHTGPNVHAIGASEEDLVLMDDQPIHDRKAVYRSPLFWWIIFSVVVPLLAAMSAISIYVLVDLSETLPKMVDFSGDLYSTLERAFLSYFANSRAIFIQEAISIQLRDLHVINRITGWLAAGSVAITADSMTPLLMMSEVCKEYNPFNDSCPVYRARQDTCACDWNDPWGYGCEDYSPSEQRRYQMMYYSGLREDAFPNGDRNYTSYPALASSPQTTQWWPDVEDMPGYNQSSTDLLDTTFDRAKIVSALSVIQIPMYNYVTKSTNNLTRIWGTHTAFEKGGAISGYAGCNMLNAYYSQHKNERSSERSIEDICPEGKYGLDARCLNWYYLTKKRALDTTSKPLFVSPPFNQYHNGVASLQSNISLPIIIENEVVGVTMGTISLDEIANVLSEEQTPLGVGSTHLMIFAGEHAAKRDVLVASGYTFEEKPTTPSKIMLPNDFCGNSTDSCDNLREFETILEGMRSGGAGMDIFRRVADASESTFEYVTVAYSPVRAKGFRPIDPSDFSRGVQRNDSPSFSVGFTQTEEGISLSYSSVQDSLDGTLRSSVFVLVVTVLTAFVLLFPVTAWISMSVVVPVTQLCELITHINRNETNFDFPYIVRGSSEVSKVRSTFERLHKVVRVGNMAFFMGELEKADSVLYDALKLFTRLKNKKAIGIANNNLGILMLTVYRAMKKTNIPTLIGLSSKNVIAKGCKFFKEAINLGEEALKTINNEEGFSVNYLIFMQQLSNRYFNRGIFLLTVKSEHTDPVFAEQQGMTDLMTCRDMDREVVDNGDSEGFKGDKDVHFELLLSRIKGLLLLMKMGYEDPWGIDDLFEEARAALDSALKSPDHPLFNDLDPPGQMQRLDSVLIDYHLHMATSSGDNAEKGKQVREAAEIAIRMMIEDEYVIGESAILALKALVDSTHWVDGEIQYGGMDVSDVRSTLFQYRHSISEVLSLSYATTSLLDRECFNASNAGDFNMEVF